MNPHVFVAMPFGVKEGIDFNRVYREYIAAALREEGFEVFRADEEMRGGEIRADMFQELLLADLVVVDLSIDNPNVWYELGVRHALRSRGVILVQSKREYVPFDVYTDRKIRYSVRDGGPDPATLEADKNLLRRFARETLESWQGRKISPVYQLLPYLEEPEWKKLYVEGAGEYRDQYENWRKRVETARRDRKPANILVLAEEAPNHALLREARVAAGKALLKLGHFSFALEQLEKGLEKDPEDAEMLRLKAVALGRLGRNAEAKGVLEGLEKHSPGEAETPALLGRVVKDAWISGWRRGNLSPEAMREEATAEEGLLREAMETYSAAFRLDPAHYYSGINAVTLHHVLAHLTGEDGDPGSRSEIEGGVRWAIRSALSRETVDGKDYWARVSLADLELLTAETRVVERAYRDAVAVADGSWFDLDSSRQQLLILRDLGFRPPQVEAALKVLEREIAKVTEPWRPRKVFLFSGHMIDEPGREEARFPPEKEPAVAEALRGKLEELGAGEGDLAVCGGACGGDVLFGEVALERGLRLSVRIPFPEAEFLEKSVRFAGEGWVARFMAMKGHPKAKLSVMTDDLGPTPENVDAYERDNLWQLYYALSWGPEKVVVTALWDGKPTDRRGGTQHMCESVKKRAGDIHIIDITKL